ncbi:MAG: GYD domain-containing protein [Pseudomonadota bacterium]|nr:GYD domain-containing protein [Pseudomonadota bacterium]
MPDFIMLTRLSPELLRNPKSMEDLERQAMEHVRASCPQVEWLHSYAVSGPYDYLDIFTAPDNEVATQVSILFRIYGRAHSEIWSATGWARFKEMLHGLSGH